MTGRHRTLDLLAHRLDRAANTIPDIYDHLQEQRSYVVVLAAQDTTTGPHGNTISDPTLITVIALDEAAYRRQAIDDYIASIALGVKLLEQECRRALSWRMGQHDDPDTAHLDDTPTCTEAGCTQIPATRTDRDGYPIDDGRCLDCGRAADQRRHTAHLKRLRELNYRHAR